MIRAKNILVALLFIFFSASLFAADENKEQTPVRQDTEQTEPDQELNDQAPAKANPDNDRWRNESKKHRIPQEFEITQPLITYKDQQVA